MKKFITWFEQTEIHHVHTDRVTETAVTTETDQIALAETDFEVLVVIGTDEITMTTVIKTIVVVATETTAVVVTEKIVVVVTEMTTEVENSNTEVTVVEIGMTTEIDQMRNENTSIQNANCAVAVTTQADA